MVERTRAAVKQVNVIERCPAEDPVSERSVVDAIAEAARNDRNDLTTVSHQLDCQAHEPSVEIDRFQPYGAQQGTVLRAAVDLLVWRIQNCVSKPGPVAVLPNPVEHSIVNEVPLENAGPQGRSGLTCKRSAKVGGEMAINLVGCRGHAAPSESAKKGRGE